MAGLCVLHNVSNKVQSACMRFGRRQPSCKVGMHVVLAGVNDGGYRESSIKTKEEPAVPCSFFSCIDFDYHALPFQIFRRRVAFQLIRE